MPVDDRGESESEFQRWACEQLNVPGGAAPEAERAAFLKRVQADRFLPSAMVHDAFDTLRGVPVDDSNPVLLCENARDEISRRVSEQVESFAGEFFRLPIAERARRWQTLQLRAQPFPRILARLNLLQAGLAVDFNPPGEAAPLIDRLTRACCDLFVLRPSEAAVLRQSLEAEFSVEPSTWTLAAKLLRGHAPEIARLTPKLIDYLQTHTDRAEASRQGLERVARARAAAERTPKVRIERPENEGFEFDAYSLGQLFWVIALVLIAAFLRWKEVEEDSRNRRRMIDERRAARSHEAPAQQGGAQPAATPQTPIVEIPK
jgi:hypothetical protein